MEAILQFLKHHPDIALATVGDDGLPKIRVFRIMKQDRSTLYFATAPHKEVYRQLQRRPQVELLAMSGSVSVRLTGTIYFDVADSVGEEIYNSTPILKRLYVKHSDLVYMRLPIMQATYFDTAPTPPLVKHYNLQNEQQ